VAASGRASLDARVREAAVAFGRLQPAPGAVFRCVLEAPAAP